MAKTFRPYNPDQMFLLPPSLQEWVPQGHVARFVGELVDTMDLSAIEDAYDEERGYPPYDPRMMVKVLLYGYCTGTYSSRKLAARIRLPNATSLVSETCCDTRPSIGPCTTAMVKLRTEKKIPVCCTDHCSPRTAHTGNAT